MLNRARNPRSMSGFVFERLDAQGKPSDTFYGAKWENKQFVYINGYLCVSIKLFGDQDPPYLNPSDCSRGFASIVQPRPDEDRAQLFWTPKPDGSTHFRVLFAKEEVARCEIQAGTCEVYVP